MGFGESLEERPLGKSVLKATRRNILAASRKVKEGGVVVYPTDTVYGLGCDPFVAEAVERVFNVKNERKKALPILGSDMEMVERIAILPEKAKSVANEFWPGPLTIVVPRKPSLPSIVTCDLNSVGVRVPKHDVALQLISLSNGLMIGTSANKTGKKPPLTAQDAAEQLGREVDLVLDGGPVTLGVSSTVVDLTSEEPRILRKGPIGFEEIEQLLSKK